MKCGIRRCELGDAPAIYELNRREMGYEYPLEQTARKLERLLADDAHRIYVAEWDGTVVGYIHAQDYDVLYAPHYKNVLGIAVFAEHRHQGIGRMLLSAVENWGKETGAAGIRLVSGAGRTGAHAFYRHCGYDGGKQQINFKKIF